MIKHQEAVRLPCPVCGQSCRAEVALKHKEAAGLPQSPLGWPSLEVIAREIRRAMLDNPTDDSFNKRSEKREAIANEAAGIIMARFLAALSDTRPLQGGK